MQSRFYRNQRCWSVVFVAALILYCLLCSPDSKNENYLLVDPICIMLHQATGLLLLISKKLIYDLSTVNSGYNEYLIVQIKK